MNHHPWQPEQTLEPSLALQLVQEQFPELNATSIKLLGAGWDNTAFLINEALVFRFPRRQIALPLLEAEWNILPKIAPLLPLPVPHPLWKGSATAKFPWPFIGYKSLTGATACSIDLCREERKQLAKPLASFLRILHALPPSMISAYVSKEDNKARIDASQLLPKIEKAFNDLTDLDLLDNRDQLEIRIKNLKPFRDPDLSSIVHGDFYVRHILIDASHHLCGVIDWGDVHIGDPAIDLAIAHSFLPKEAHALFLENYGSVSAQTWALAKIRAIYSSSLITLFGHHSGDVALKKEGLRSLKEFTSL